MNDVQRYLVGNFTGAMDRFEDQMLSGNPTSLEDLKRMFPLTVEMTLAQWAASLDIKTRHDLMKSTIDNIR